MGKSPRQPTRMHVGDRKCERVRVLARLLSGEMKVDGRSLRLCYPLDLPRVMEGFGSEGLP